MDENSGQNIEINGKPYAEMAERAGIKVDIINAEAEIEVEKYLKKVLKHKE
ncbi:hypothetical protein [Natronincola peptidivorans]|uniref:hypothetical protein n=1 Tax=Natronincola peptidivorans TaxID=426128 RepID=UPI00147A31F3|nr:hypothetical protein [Natronincola peptidivorans]